MGCRPLPRVFRAGVLALSLVPAAASALGLGQAVVESRLGEPLSVAIPLLGDGSMQWPVACRWRWSPIADAGMSPPRAASLRYEERDDGPFVVLGTGRGVREPILEFAVSMACGPRAEVERRYMVLVDPPAGVVRRPAVATPPRATGERPAGPPPGPRPASPPPPRQPSAPPAGGTEYQVRPGDSLLGIVHRHYGTATGNPWARVREIVAANPGAFPAGDPDRLAAGVTLRLPPAGESPPAPVSALAPAAPEPEPEPAPGAEGRLRILPAEEEPAAPALRLGWELSRGDLERAVDASRVAVVRQDLRDERGGRTHAPEEVPDTLAPSEAKEALPGPGETAPEPSSAAPADPAIAERLERDRQELQRLQARVAELEALLTRQAQAPAPSAPEASPVPTWLWWLLPVALAALIAALVVALVALSRRRDREDAESEDLQDFTLELPPERRVPATGPGDWGDSGAAGQAEPGGAGPTPPAAPGATPSPAEATVVEYPGELGPEAPTRTYPPEEARSWQPSAPASPSMEDTLRVPSEELERALDDSEISLDLDLGRGDEKDSGSEVLNLSAGPSPPRRGIGEETLEGLPWQDEGHSRSQAESPEGDAGAFGGRSISGLLLEVELHLLFEQYGEAVSTLETLIDRDSESAPDMRPWAMLFSVYRQQGDRVRFNALRERFTGRYNVIPPGWDEERRGEGERPSLDEKFPRVLARIEQVWGTRHAGDFLNGLLLDDRGGQRQGFDMEVAEDISFLRELYAIRRQL